jgi:hypothetical protein
MCLLTLKWLMNIFQNFWKLCIFWNLLHKPWRNNINFKKIWILFWRFFRKHFKEYFLKCSLKNSPKSKRVWFMLSHLHSYNLMNYFLHWTYWHYYQSGVQFTSLNHYRTFKNETTSLHFTKFTLVKVISL